MTQHTHSQPSRRTHSRIALALALSSLAFAAACGSPTSSGASSASGAAGSSGGGAIAEVAAVQGGAAQRLTVKVGNSVQFSPSRLAVKAGQPVDVVLENDGAIPHDFTLTDGVAAPVKIEAQGGQTARGTFTVTRPGTYTFVCSVPGHALAGMRGTITAQ